MEQITLQINTMDDVIREIDNCHLKAFTAMVELGYILRKADDAQLFREKGYSSIFEFAKETYGWDQSKTSRYMDINRQYSVGGYSTELLPQYEGYGPAKLSEMLTLPEIVREEISADMKREEIREIKREYKAAEQEQKEAVFVAAVEMEPTEHSVLQECAEGLLGQNSFKNKFEAIYKCMKELENGTYERDGVDEEDIMFAVSGGNGTSRVGNALIFWGKDSFKILKGTNKKEYQYSDLIRAAVGIASTFGRSAAEWYEDVYKTPLQEPKPQKKATSKPATKKSPQKGKKKLDSPAKDRRLEAFDAASAQEEREELPGQTTFEGAETEKTASFAPARETAVPPAETMERVDGEIVEKPEKTPDFETPERSEVEMPSAPAEKGHLNGIEPEEVEEADKNSVSIAKNIVSIAKNIGKPAVDSIESENEDAGQQDDEENECFCSRIGAEICSNDGEFRIIHGKGGMCRVERGIYHAIMEMRYCPECGKELSAE